MWVQSLRLEDALGEEMATHSSNPAWRIPWTEEPGWLQSIASQSWTRLKRFSNSTQHHSSVQFSHSVVSDSLRPHESQHARPPCPSPTPGVHSDSCPLSQ